MAGEAAEFLLSLGDSVTPNAVKIAASLEGMSSATQKAITQAAKLDAMMAKTAASNAKAAQSSAKAALDQHKLAEANGTAATSSGELAGKLGDLAGGATEAGGVVGKLQGYLSALGPEGQVAAAAIGVATIALVAFTAAALGGMEAAIKVSEAAEEMRATMDALAGGSAGGGAVVATVQKLSTTLPFATSQIGEWAKSLLAAGVKSDKLEASIKAVASAQALMGESGGAAAQTLITKLAEGGAGADALIKSLKDGGGKSNKMLAEMGLSTKDLAGALGMSEAAFKTATLSAAQMQDAINKALTQKGAGALENMVGDLSTIVMKAKEGFMSLFKDLGPAVKPFMAALQSLLGMFNKTGSATSALRPIVTAVFTQLFTWATMAVNAVKGVVLWLMASGKAGGMFSGVIAVLKAGWAALGGIFTNVKTALTPVIAVLKAIFRNALVLNGIKTIFTVIGAAIVGVITIVAAFVGAVVTMVGVVVGAFAAVLGAVVGALGSFADYVTQGIDALGDLGSGATDAASNFVAGLVDGISAGAGAVAAAVKGLASGALAAFTGALGIASPSKIMLEHGEDNIAGAAATGVDKGADKMDASMARLGAPPSGKGKQGGKDGAKGGGGFTAYFDRCVFGAGLTQEMVDEMMAAWWDRAEGEAGAAPAGG